MVTNILYKCYIQIAIKYSTSVEYYIINELLHVHHNMHMYPVIPYYLSIIHKTHNIMCSTMIHNLLMSGELKNIIQWNLSIKDTLGP